MYDLAAVTVQVGQDRIRICGHPTKGGQLDPGRVVLVGKETVTVVEAHLPLSPRLTTDLLSTVRV